MYKAKSGMKDEQGKLSAGHELWRKSITLGSMLCSEEDITRRISLGYVAVDKYNKAWSNKIPLNKALAVSVIMYNSNSWAAPKSVLEKLVVVHSRHLRNIMNYSYPNIISDENFENFGSFVVKTYGRSCL